MKEGTNMKKYQLIGQPIRVGEIYNHHGDLYRVESFDDDCIMQKVTLRRIKDDLIVDAESPALFLTPDGVQLLWPKDINVHYTPMGRTVGGLE